MTSSSLDQSLPDIVATSKLAASCKESPSAISGKDMTGEWDSEYQSWSCGEGASWNKNSDKGASHPDLVVDGSDVWNESGSDTTDFMLNWLKDIPDNPAPVEPSPPVPQPEPVKVKKTTSKPKNYSYSAGGYHDNKQIDKTGKGYGYEKEESENEVDYRRFSIASEDDDNIIPFDSKPIVSKFGPICRGSLKPRTSRSYDPLQVSAEETIITSVTSALSSKPQVFPTQRAASRIVNQPIVSVENTMVNFPPNVKSCVKKEIARLEEKALNADTEDEWLACELQAVELQISLQSAKNISGLSKEDLTGTKHWTKTDRPESGYSDWSNLDKALQAQEMATECLKYRKKQEKEDRLLAQKLVLEELKAAGPNS